MLTRDQRIDGHTTPPKRYLSTLVLVLVGCAISYAPKRADAHAGSIDANGGHYFGNTYHCHMGGCEMPDTFSRVGRDSALFDRRSREKFFAPDDWSYEEDFDNDCQSTRQEMLILTSREQPRFTNPRNCVVRLGDWLDEYTGKTFKVATQMDLDHVIPLMYAHIYGGDRWSAQKKLQFANDPMNLLLVDRKELRKKRNRGPSSYLPRDAFQCEYAKLWRGLAVKYELRIDNRDERALDKLGEECGTE